MTDQRMTDETRLTPRACAHSLRFLGAAVDCERGPDHDGAHGSTVTASAYRTVLGIWDGVSLAPVFEWQDTRPAATAGDLRRRRRPYVDPRPITSFSAATNTPREGSIMGREVKRVPLDFEWPSDQTWKGYVLPDELRGQDCEACGGRGYSPQAQRLWDLWYGNTPFTPEDNGSTALTVETPEVRAFAERNVAHAPEYYGSGEAAIRREARRLASIWNGQWSHHLNEEDVAALLEAESIPLRDLTHTWDRDAGWQPKDPAVRPSAADVNAWQITNMAGSSVAYAAVKARCEREGWPETCSICDGHGSIEKFPGQRAEAEAWEHYEPPTGDGWQLWQTVSDAPISPVFPDAEGLIEWMTTPAAKWGAAGPWSREDAAAFVNGPGWAPTGIGGSDGVTAMARMAGAAAGGAQ